MSSLGLAMADFQKTFRIKEMADAPELSEKLTLALQRHAQGQDARDAIIEASCERIVCLSHHALRCYPGVARWEDTDDIAQNVSLRLWQSLKSVAPPTLLDLLRFTSVQIRRELIDMARKYSGPEGLNANYKSIGSRIFRSSIGGTDESHEPIHLASWAEFHVAVDALPEDERATFDLLWYQGLSQSLAAEVLAISERTIRRRWRTARARVLATLTGEPFDEPVSQ